MSQRDKEGKVLDAFVEMSVADGLPSLEEAQEQLRAMGAGPETLALLVGLCAEVVEDLTASWFRSGCGPRGQEPIGLTQKKDGARWTVTVADENNYACAQGDTIEEARKALLESPFIDGISGGRKLVDLTEGGDES